MKWFDPTKNFGFIELELLADGAKQPDIFVHYSGIRGSGWRNLGNEDIVEFEIIAGLKGPQANDVVVLVPGKPIAATARGNTQELDDEDLDVAA